MSESEKDQILTPFTGVNNFDLVVTADESVLELNNCPSCGPGHPFVVIPQKGMVPGFAFRNTTPFHQYVESIFVNGQEVELEAERRLLPPSTQLVLKQEELARYASEESPEFGFIILRMTMPYPHEIDQYELPARRALVQYLEVVNSNTIRELVMAVLDSIRKSVVTSKQGVVFEFATAEFATSVKEAKKNLQDQLGLKIEELLRDTKDPVIIGVLTTLKNREPGSLPNFGNLLDLFGMKGKMDA